MNTKNRTIMIILTAILALVAIAGIYLKNNKKETNNDIDLNKKTLVVYFSAQNHTKALAEKIAKKLNADIFEIVPQEKYTSEDLNYNDENSRVSIEHNDTSKRHVLLEQTVPDNWDSYENVIIAYPIWWGIAAWPASSFVIGNTFDNKNVYPICTSASSGLGDSAKNLKSISSGGTWFDGYRFSSNVSDKDIDNWLKIISK